ncbi:caskin-1-like [Triticum urartu]|uniref:caskin-1-like n=1 Tax=Triticum urartu TaxID=4572 RepID=UPI00204485C6|nr:caskin-1-like [Triticum urartu]
MGLTRHPSPRAARRRSQELLTPPASPPLSPTIVLPPSPWSTRNEARSVALLQTKPSQPMLELCSPTMLLLPLASPARPPGFEASPTPPLVSSGPLRRTPSPVQRRRADAATCAVGLQCLAPLFEDREESILPAPAATPPRAPAARRKTMAGVTISRVGGTLSIHKTRPASRAKANAALASRAAEFLVCRSLGIIKDGEDVTSAALDAFAERFKEELSPEVIADMRRLFKLDESNAQAVEDALLVHGGGGALDLERPGEEAALQQTAN